MYRFISLLTVILLFSSASSYASFGSSTSGFANGLFTDSEFLPVDDAFRFRSRVEGNNIILLWDIEEGYYLYKERFKFEIDALVGTLGTPVYSLVGEKKDDPYFGEVTVFHKDIMVQIPVTLNNLQEASIDVSYQGCADAGLCYPPQTKTALFIKNTNTSSSALTKQAANNNQSLAADYDSANGIFSFIQTASLPAIIGIFFLLGLGLTFTPCVFPMIPIISSIIAGQKNPTTLKSFNLSFAYVLGMSLTYAAAGVITGLLGASANIQAYLQAPAVLITFSIVFVLLALSMFGFYELQLPERLRDRLNNKSQNIRGGQSLSVFFIGALSALIVSPCVSAPLAGALLYISTTADATLGGLSLFALGLGMGVPLIAVGVGGGKFLPKAGHWMNAVKAVFGIMLIAVAIWLLERLLPSTVTLLLWSLLVGLSGAQMGAFEAAKFGWERLGKGLGLFLVLYATTLFIGALTGASDPLNPLEKLISSNAERSTSTTFETAAFERVYNLDQFNTLTEQSIAVGKPILLDFYADWCISCKVMEREVFSKPLPAELMSNFTLVQADVTENDVDNQLFLDEFGLFGPPSILFFDSNGNELINLRVMGELDEEQFINKLNDVLSQLNIAT
ncbi:protein-disulfide reductase DsbD [Alkalimarinus alittae]|uniref:Thiol:disulfide interchange protein DsbD n=1 Tax=Alkalimarinus alittae TaxID=2961619 RepID=A0ABY6MXT8_9ALTE|nr:protein-disulfide reductase DsbD [Alkalimarinus alittae]UZE94640.1 protein-disulfide reductase DsbD [Alkalimarinus alittae]